MSHESVFKHTNRKSRKGERNGPSVNKYQHLVPPRPGAYDPSDKTYRDLPIVGERGEVIKAGLRMLFHGRIYSLMEDTIIPRGAPPCLSEEYRGKFEGVGRFKIVAQVS